MERLYALLVALALVLFGIILYVIATGSPIIFFVTVITFFIVNWVLRKSDVF